MKPWAVVAIALAAFFIGVGTWDVKTTADIQRRDSLITALRVRAEITDTVFRTQRDTTIVTRTRWRETVDTLVLTERESVIVAAADTAINACSIALGTCEQRVAERDSLLVLQMQQTAAWRRKAQPCRVLGMITCPVITVGAYVTTDMRPTLGVGVGIPILGR